MGKIKAARATVEHVRNVIRDILAGAQAPRAGRELNTTARGALSHYGATEDPRKAGYILPDGQMLDFSRGNDYRSLPHGDVALLPDIDLSNRITPEAAFMEQADALRFDPDALLVEGTKVPTSRARGALVNAFDDPYLFAEDVLFEATDPTTMQYVGGKNIHKPSSPVIQGFYSDALKRRSLSKFGQKVDRAIREMDGPRQPNSGYGIYKALEEEFPSDVGALGDFFRRSE